MSVKSAFDCISFFGRKHFLWVVWTYSTPVCPHWHPFPFQLVCVSQRQAACPGFSHQLAPGCLASGKPWWKGWACFSLPTLTWLQPFCSSNFSETGPLQSIFHLETTPYPGTQLHLCPLHPYSPKVPFSILPIPSLFIIVLFLWAFPLHPETSILTLSSFNTNSIFCSGVICFLYCFWCKRKLYYAIAFSISLQSLFQIISASQQPF